MQRVTITIDDELVEQVDEYAAQRGYQNRSEAIRDLTRSGLRSSPPNLKAESRDRVIALLYVYDHHVREMADRLTKKFHHHHSLSLASMHVHLDEATCLEAAILRGPGKDVAHFSEHLIAERGVREGQIFVVPLGATAHNPKKPKARKAARRHRQN